MMRLMTALVTFSLLACSSIQRPDSWICGVNAKGMKLRCYNLKSDYDQNGSLNPGAKPQEYPLKSINDLNAWVCMDPASLEKMKIYMGDLRDYAKAHCQ